MMKKISLLILIFLLNDLQAQVVSLDLSANWKFSEAGKNEWLPATVPGTIHTDLMANGKIPDPYIYINESKVQWVEHKTWEYKTSFDCPKEIWKQKEKRLYFDGLDTYADVYLNDTLLFTAENMFIAFQENVNRLLKKKNNSLRIVFHPASELIEKNQNKNEFKSLPGGDRVFIRKAQYQFGWDWGPRLVTCGIWKKIRLEGWSGPEIEDLFFKTDAIQNDTAFLQLAVIFRDEVPLGKKVDIRITDGEGKTVYQDLWMRSAEKAYGFNVPVNIPKPRLWWCNGMGKPEMYDFICTFRIGKKTIVRKLKYGIRKIELDEHPDKHGSSFSILLNDLPVFIKGANWIPSDNFLPRMSSEKYYSLLKNAQQSNMNMLRVWGGGVYEDDRFYENCDSLGIMVWQDLMFACAMYPYNIAFNQTVQEEIVYQFPRINRHVSVALWCGNNENTEGWMNWGWQKEFKMTERDSAMIGSTYFRFFYQDIRTALVTDSRNVIYWPSSPSIGWGHKEAYQQGDVHYWGVWWGMEPFSSYENHVGRFVSEYGFQGMPDERSFDHFAGIRFLDLNDSVVRSHQKHPTGYETINTYMQRDYPVPADFGDYIYVSQIVQRDGMQKAIEAHRRAMPYCMGTLFWQYNDCWPVTSWSSVDFYGRPKLFQYALPDLYAPVLVSVTERNDSVLIYLINDDTLVHEGVFAFTWTDFNGRVVRASQGYESVSAFSAAAKAGFPKKLLLDSLAAENGVLKVSFQYENGKSVSATHYFTSPKNLKLNKDPGITTEVKASEKNQGTFLITVQSKSFAKDVYLSVDDQTTRFSANGFDLAPGEVKTITIHSSASIDEIRKQLKIRSMNGML